MKKTIFRFLVYSLAMAGGGLSVLGQSSFNNPVWKPYLRVQVPFVQPQETDGYETNVFSFVAMATNGVDFVEIGTSNITTKLNPFRKLRYCDFVLQITDQNNPENQVSYVYSSTPQLSAPGQGVADVYYQMNVNCTPSRFRFRKSSGAAVSIMEQSTNSACNIEIWPDRTQLAKAGINENSRNLSIVCTLLNGIDAYHNPISGEAELFPVKAEWRQFPPDYKYAEIAAAMPGLTIAGAGDGNCNGSWSWMDAVAIYGENVGANGWLLTVSAGEEWHLYFSEIQGEWMIIRYLNSTPSIRYAAATGYGTGSPPASGWTTVFGALPAPSVSTE